MYVFRNFVWILGLSMILAALSYQEYLTHLPNAPEKGIKLWKNASFLKPFYLGSALTLAGIGATIDSPILGALASVEAFFLTWAFLKTIVAEKARKT
jgi:hypothetical protein